LKRAGKFDAWRLEPAIGNAVWSGVLFAQWLRREPNMVLRYFGSSRRKAAKAQIASAAS